MASLEINGGAPPPAADSEPRPQRGADTAGPAPPLVQPVAGEEPQWERETLKTLVALPFMGLHIAARRQGPPDAWMPDDDELEVMVGPLLGMANRYAMLRALARFGDPVAFTAAVGTYTVSESRRIARWRLQFAEERLDEPEPDFLPEELHVAAERPGERPPRAPVDAPVRAWRPPTFAGES